MTTPDPSRSTTRQVARTGARRRARRPRLRQLRADRKARRTQELDERRSLYARYRHLGDGRGPRRRFGARVLFESVPPAFEVSSACLEAVYPFQTRSRTPDAGSGIAIGPSPTGGVFCWDPWTLYQQGRLTNPNVLILGDVGSGKSSLAKTLVWRGLEFGRGAHIIDPKGEYGPLASAADTEPIALAPGGGTVINPLDPGTAGGQLAPTDLFHRNLATVRALLEATLARPCRQLEMVLLAAALARVAGLDLTLPDLDGPTSVARHGGVVTLPMLAEALVDPPDDLARRVNMDPGRVIEETREMALALARLVDTHGDLSGMFAGHTNLDVDALGDLVVIDIATVYRTHRAVLPLVMVCAAAWLQLATATSPRGRFQVNDEAWALLSDQASARWMQANQKLARQLSLSVVNVMHRLSDTAAVGDRGTATRSLAEGVIADSGTWIIYRQKPSETPLLCQTLQLNDLQCQLATRIGRGRALWIVGGETRDVALVDHTLSHAETTLIDTDQAARAADEPDAR